MAVVTLVLVSLVGNKAAQVAIARKGGIAPLVALAHGGTDGQKYAAALALADLADNDDNKEAIVRAGGIPLFVALTRDGTEEQKYVAAAALQILAVNNAHNQMEIARAGGIAPLVALGQLRKRFMHLRLGQLRAELTKRGLSTAGRKAELRERLTTWLTSSLVSGA